MNYLTVIALATVLLGIGCQTAPPYQKAEPKIAPEVKPNPEGAKASTGGAEATITPQLATELLVRSLPEPTYPWGAMEPVESKLPIPLPDGTRTEYTRVDREYRKADTATRYVKVSISDTRGIPALLLFLNAFEAYNNPSGYRKELVIPNAKAWLAYTDGRSEFEPDYGSITLVYRDRFLIQIDGGEGISSEELESLVRTFNFDALK